jgi:hypothetical protein
MTHVRDYPRIAAAFGRRHFDLPGAVTRDDHAARRSNGGRTGVMNAEFFALAFTAALNAKLLAVDLLLIENSRPRAMFACILAGAMGVAIGFGLVDVWWSMPMRFRGRRNQAQAWISRSASSC